MMIVMFSRPAFPRRAANPAKALSDSPWLMTGPLLFLSFCAIFGGYLTHKMILGLAIFTHPDKAMNILDAQCLPDGFVPLIFLPLSFLFLFNLLIFAEPTSSSWISLRIDRLLSSDDDTRQAPSPFVLMPGLKMLDLPLHPFSQFFTSFNHFNIFNHWVKFKVLILSNYLYRYLDKGFLEGGFGPLGCHRLFNFIGFNIELLATGFIPHYILINLFSLFLLLLL